MAFTRVVVAVALTAVALAGCSADKGSRDIAQPVASASAAAPVPTDAELLLAEYDLDGTTTVEMVDRLDRLGGDERPVDLMASVRPDELLVSSGEEEFSLDIPDDRFYLSVAPFVDRTHECFYHSLTTCQGELASKDVHVQVVDETDDKVLVDEVRTTFENGFVGLWLPRDIRGTLRMTHDGMVGEVDFAADEDAPTCVTTLQLV